MNAARSRLWIDEVFYWKAVPREVCELKRPLLSKIVGRFSAFSSIVWSGNCRASITGARSVDHL